MSLVIGVRIHGHQQGHIEMTKKKLIIFSCLVIFICNIIFILGLIIYYEERITNITHGYSTIYNLSVEEGVDLSLKYLNKENDMLLQMKSIFNLERFYSMYPDVYDELKSEKLDKLYIDVKEFQTKYCNGCFDNNSVREFLEIKK